MKIRTKILIGFGSVLFLMIIFLWIVMNVIGILKGNLKDVVDDRYYKIKLLANITSNLDKMYELALHDIYLTTDPKRLKEKLQEYEIEIETDWTALNKVIVLPEARRLVKEIETVYNPFIRDVRKLVDNGIMDGTSTALFANNRVKLNDLFEKFRDFQEQRMNDTIGKANHWHMNTMWIFLVSILVLLLIGISIAYWLLRTVSIRLKEMIHVMNEFTDGNTDQFPRIDVTRGDELDSIGLAFNRLSASLEEHILQEENHKYELQKQNWIKTKVIEINEKYQAVRELDRKASVLLTQTARIVGAQYGAFYFVPSANTKELLKIAAYSDKDDDYAPSHPIKFGEGLVGQCAKDREEIYLEDSRNGIRIQSGLGEIRLHELLLLPVIFHEEVIAVLELATLTRFDEGDLAMLRELMPHVATAFKAASDHNRIQHLLKEAQIYTEELQAQSEELQQQQEELRALNEKLEEQYRGSEQKTRELEAARLELEHNSLKLQQSSRYKSEFLANMSHELRTPLNSLLILAQMLMENRETNLTLQQVEYAKTIHASGSDLLRLINEILDLTKIEAGKTELVIDHIQLETLTKSLEQQFRPIVQRKNLEMIVDLDPELTELEIYSDEHKIQQIVRNLLSNATKFTEKGSISLRLFPSYLETKVHGDWVQELYGRDKEACVAISVRDTGLGIAKDKLEMIFEAFQQADGTTSRRFGGTGLGLSISRQMARILGGCIMVTSEEGIGSEFTLYLPHMLPSGVDTQMYYQEVASTIELADTLADQSETLDVILTLDPYSAEDTLHPAKVSALNGKRVLLVDDDMRNIYALTSMLESYNMKVLFAENGREALDILEQTRSIDLVLMDIMMPEMDGYDAIRKIRTMPEYDKLPIIALTAKAMKNDKEQCIEAGANDYISKPVSIEQLISLIQVWLCP